MSTPLGARQPGVAAAQAIERSPSHGGFVHSVYFWLRPDLSAAQLAAFVRGLESLRRLETVRHGWIGVPAATDRPVIDRGYSYALTLVFANDADQDAYQIDPVHDRFREAFAEFWTRVQIYDSTDYGYVRAETET